MHPLFRQCSFRSFVLVLLVLILSIYLTSCNSVDDQPNLVEVQQVSELSHESNISTISASSTTSTTPSTTTTQNPEDLKISVENTCFYSEDQLCSVRNMTEKFLSVKCDCQLHPLYKKALFCCNVTDIDKALNCANANLTNLQHLHIRNASVDEIDFSGKICRLIKFRSLHHYELKLVRKYYIT